MERNVDLEVENKYLKRRVKQLEDEVMILLKNKKNCNHYIYCPKCRKKLDGHKGSECNRW